MNLIKKIAVLSLVPLAFAPAFFFEGPKVAKAEAAQVEIPEIPRIVSCESNENQHKSDCELIAKLLWGECRGCSMNQKAAVVWVVLNRVDSSKFPNTISDVVRQPCQFAGYIDRNPVDPELYDLASDVIKRWEIEDDLIGSSGRIIPKSYLFFWGDGTVNHFSEDWHDSEEWDFSFPSPYKED